MNFREARQDDVAEVMADSISRPDKGTLGQPNAYAWTLEHEGVILAMGGMWLMAPTTAFLWANLTSRALEHRVTVYRTIRDWLDRLPTEYGIRLMLATVREGFEEGSRLVRHLGFETICLLPNYHGDEDAFLYARREK